MTGWHLLLLGACLGLAGCSSNHADPGETSDAQDGSDDAGDPGPSDGMLPDLDDPAGDPAPDASDPGPAEAADAADAGDAGDPAGDAADAADGADNDGLGPTDGDQPPEFPPESWGPYPVGVRSFQFYDSARFKLIETIVWFPGVAPGPDDKKNRYMLLLEGNSYEDLAVEPSGAPYPLVLFSHGNKGINFQSYSFTEFLASHGFVVASPNHRGNTMFDNPSHEEMAEIALQRPVDIAFVLQKMQELTSTAGDPFEQRIDTGRVGMAGHSFGGYTALVVAGGTQDVDAALQRCLEGSASDVFCPYVVYWPAGTVVLPPPGLENVRCSLAMAPGGYGAFGDDGLAGIEMPVMIMAGLIDEWMPLDAEPRPIYAALTSTAYKLEIAQAGHMNFTDICRIPLNQLIPELAEMCDPDVYLGIDRSFEIINPFGVAFFRRHLRDESGMEAYLSATYAAGFPEAAFTRKP
jgi:predicted dienelactone hydrolase